MIEYMFWVGVAFLAAVGVVLGQEAYAAGFSWEGASLLGVVAWQTMAHLWRRTVGEKED